MAIWNLGSINQDVVYSVPRIPLPGETLSSTSRDVFLGGKGTNMSVAAARAAAQVHHVGAIGRDSLWAVDRLMEYGVDTRFISELETDAAQAIILVDPHGENAIVLHPGANHEIPQTTLQSALAEAETGDWLVMQNETNLQRTAAALGRKLGLRIAYAAALSSQPGLGVSAWRSFDGGQTWVDRVAVTNSGSVLRNTINTVMNG